MIARIYSLCLADKADFSLVEIFASQNFSKKRAGEWFPIRPRWLTFGWRLRSPTGLAVLQRNKTTRHAEDQRVACGLRSRERLHQAQVHQGRIAFEQLRRVGEV